MNEQIEWDFNYHAPDEQRRIAHQQVRDAYKQVAYLLDALPGGRETAVARTNLEQSMFWANAAIARSKA